MLLFFSAALAASPPGPWDRQTVSLPGRGDDGAPLTMHYLAAGPPDAPVVVLLHGFPDFSYGWRGVIPLLSEDYRVLAPDLRGYGETDITEGGYEMDSLIGDVTAFIDATTDGPVHLIAHDWGALIGWNAVMADPSRYRTWTAVNIPHPQTLAEYWLVSPEQRQYKKFYRQVRSPPAPRLLSSLSTDRMADAFYRAELVNDAVLTDEDAEHYHDLFGQRDRVWAALQYYHHSLSLKNRDLAALRAAELPVAVDTLVVWGGQDHYMMSPMAALSCGVVTARCESAVFEDAGHYLHWELPEDMVTRWRAFVAEDGQR
ncbi:MAG: pimeloyl-ACP methyl ester carboxylesterase [Myxococcota bacterium]|jgi:pimeloyl-ACP methyl ester carboxylesterase